MSKIIVVGSSNTDMVVHTSHLPVPGETILGGKFLMNQGGKGANQAVAVKRLGGNLIFVAKLEKIIQHERRIVLKSYELRVTSAFRYDSAATRSL